MKRFLIIVGIAAAIILGLVITLACVGDKFLFWYARPSSPFSLEHVPPAPDYAQDRFWAAIPSKPSDAKSVLPGTTITSNESLSADLFYIHGTGYFSSKSWNSPMAPNSAAAEQTRSMLAWQASAFNACCQVYAPQYREANLYSFIDQGDNGAAQKQSKWRIAMWLVRLTTTLVTIIKVVLF